MTTTTDRPAPAIDVEGPEAFASVHDLPVEHPQLRLDRLEG